jgi:hypothetical protein
MAKTARKPKRKLGRPKDMWWSREEALLYIVTRDFRYTQKCRRDLKKAHSEQQKFIKEHSQRSGEEPRRLRNANLLSYVVADKAAAETWRTDGEKFSGSEFTKNVSEAEQDLAQSGLFSESGDEVPKSEIIKLWAPSSIKWRKLRLLKRDAIAVWRKVVEEPPGSLPEIQAAFDEFAEVLGVKILPTWDARKLNPTQQRYKKRALEINKHELQFRLHLEDSVAEDENTAEKAFIKPITEKDYKSGMKNIKAWEDRSKGGAPWHEKPW